MNDYNSILNEKPSIDNAEHEMLTLTVINQEPAICTDADTDILLVTDIKGNLKMAPMRSDYGNWPR